MLVNAGPDQEGQHTFPNLPQAVIVDLPAFQATLKVLTSNPPRSANTPSLPTGWWILAAAGDG